MPMVLHVQLIIIILKYDCLSTLYCSNGSLFTTVHVYTDF